MTTELDEIRAQGAVERNRGARWHGFTRYSGRVWATFTEVRSQSTTMVPLAEMSPAAVDEALREVQERMGVCSDVRVA